MEAHCLYHSVMFYNKQIDRNILLTVTQPFKGQVCANSIPIPVVSTSGFLANSITNHYGYGSSTCPWLIRVPRGQRILFTLYDFTMEKRYNVKNTDGGSSFCIFYAIILDKAKDQEFTVCAGLERKQEVYTTMGSEVEVQIPQQMADEPGDKLNFLLQFVGGCSAVNSGDKYCINRGTRPAKISKVSKI